MLEVGNRPADLSTGVDDMHGKAYREGTAYAEPDGISAIDS